MMKHGTQKTSIVKLMLMAALLPLLGVGEISFAQNRWGPAETDQKFRQEMLKGHNLERSKLNLQSFTWDERLAFDARKWANHLASSKQFKHALTELRKKKQGENLWMGTANAYSHDDMVGAWLDERKYMKTGNFPHVSTTGEWSEVGHYTQIIWPTTRKVGCAKSHGGNQEYLVCRYWPAGNIMGTRLNYR